MADEQRPRVLLVEDDESDILFFTRALKVHGDPIELEIVRDGELAMRRLYRTDVPLPDWIVLDLKLPRRSGIEVLSWVRSSPSLQHLPVVILTSSGEPSDLKRIHELGIDEYLLKPVSYQALVELVGGLCSKWTRL